MDKRGNLVMVVVGLLSICCFVDSDPDTTKVYHKCNKEYDVNEIYFMFCGKTMFDALPEDTADHGYNWYTALSEGTVPCALAMEGSRVTIASVACGQTATDDVNRENYDWNMGAQFQLVDCRLRYDKYELKED